MRWDYNEEYRDMFGRDTHRDILIVPHATSVTSVSGKPPEIKNKRPVFEWVPPKSKDGKWQPKKSGGDFVLDDVDWVIDNSVLIKEKFKYSYALNSDTNLTFSSCNAAMIQFTIRNEKEYIPEIDEETGEETGEYYWEQTIPNLYKQEFTKKDPDGNYRTVTGEVLSNAIVKLYMYFNGDSDTLIYLGMFVVEEDKLVDNGYNRQITAYDFMATFRDMDIFNWYKHLFTGINKLENDFEDATNSTGEENKKPDDWDKNWVREPRDKWTIKDALEDLINNLAAYDLVVYEPVFDKETGKTKIVQTLGNTVTNPNGYGRNSEEDYPEGNGYSGFGMPIMLDEDIMTKKTTRYIPKEPGPDEHERYGYMEILELEFYQNPSVMKSQSLSMGKFLEDIGLLAGRYPFIRTDRLDEHDYIDPKEITGDNFPSKYNNYERCILSFKPLPSKEDDSKIKNISDEAFDNSEIAKGFQHDYYEVQDMLIVKFELNDGTEIEYKNLTKAQKVAAQTSQLQTLTVSNNIFASYLVTKSDDDEIKAMLDKYKAIRTDLFGEETKSGYVSYNAKFNAGYNNIRNRCYTPYKLTTYADPVRECGDRILINFKDKISGEVTTFYSYILERELSGIQKMMDTYTATGTVKNPVFTDYQNGGKSGSNSSKKANEYNFMTPFDLIEYMRNCGYRLLDEPTDCVARFCKGGEEGEDPSATHQIYTMSGWEIDGEYESYIKDGDTTNPIRKASQNQQGENVMVSIDITPGDYVCNYFYNHDDPAVPLIVESKTLYVYTLNGDWKYVRGEDEYYCYGHTYINDCAQFDVMLPNGEQENIEGATDDEIIIKVNQTAYANTVYRSRMKNTNCYEYEYYGGNENEYWGEGEVFTTTSATIKVDYGDTVASWVRLSGYDQYTYQYPGVWVHTYEYPKLDIPVSKTTKPYIELKWSDPPDIDTWEPHPIEWEGTTIVRKEDSAPKHRWDGKRITYTKTRDKYKENSYKDEDIKIGTTYYYGFFPYFTAETIDGHEIRHYTFTKVIKVETGDHTLASTIDNLTVESNDVTVYYTLLQPDVGQFTNIKIYGKIGENPACDETDDVVIDIEDGTSEKVITGLVYNSTYYFCLVTMDTNNTELSSNVESIGIETQPIYWLVNADESFISQYVSENFITNANSSNVFKIRDYSITRGSGGQWGGPGTANYSVGYQFKKGRATKLYVEIQGTWGLSQSSLGIIFFSEVPRSYSSWSSYKSVWLIQAGQSYPKNLVEVSLDDIGSDTGFYLGFACSDINVYVTKLYFDNEIIIDPVPEDYKQYIRRMNEADNGSGYWWNNFTVYYRPRFYDGSNYSDNWEITSFSECSYVSPDDNGSLVDINNYQYYTHRTIMATNLLTLYITKNNNNQYTGIINNIAAYEPLMTLIYKPSSSVVDYYYGFVMDNSKVNTMYTADQSVHHVAVTQYSYTASTLSAVLSEFSKKFRHINVYVDGVQWAKVD